MLLPPRPVAVLVLLAMGSAAAPAQESPSVWEYLARQASEQAALLPPLPTTRTAWEQQRADLLRELAVALGLPSREPMKAAVRAQREEGDLVWEEISFLWSGRTYVSASVFRTIADGGRRAAIIVPPGFLGHHQFLPYREFVRQLARQGYLVLFIDDPRSGLRRAPPAGLYSAAAAAGIPLAGIQTLDVLRGYDYLLTRPDVDPDRIGIAALNEGVLQAWLAAALEPRVAFVIAASGTTTFQALIQAAADGNGPAEPSIFVPDLIARADMDRIAACLAPRPVLIAGAPPAGWPAAGERQVQSTMAAVYGLYDATDRIGVVSADTSDSLTPLVPEVLRWLKEAAATSGAPAPPATCESPEEPEFSVLACLQRRITAESEARPLPAALADWQTERAGAVDWLRERCAIGRLQPAADRSQVATETGGVLTEQIQLGLDRDFYCPAVLFRPTAAGVPQAGIVLSHSDRSSAADTVTADAAQRLVSGGYWVLVPDHASVHMQSEQPLVRGPQPDFYGDAAAALYGPADAVGLPPLALRVAEDLAAYRHLAGRPELGSLPIIVAGLGLGSVDACLAAVLEDRIAGAVALDATTTRDWILTAAAEELRFFHLPPVLPGLLPVTDLDRLYAALAPRPLLLVRLRDGWSRSGFDHVVQTATAIYGLHAAGDALLVRGPRELTTAREEQLPNGLTRHLAAVARSLVPAPPQPGIVGSVEGLKARSSVDSATGLIWLVAELDGYDQGLGGGGERLLSWSFFNARGASQAGRSITPLLFRRDRDQYELTAIGTTRTNAGTGVQTFDFAPVAGTAEVGDDSYFGWHTGDAQGHWNPGVIEYQDARDARMLIVTADGQMNNQTPELGRIYRLQSQFPRRYSVSATTRQP